MRQVALSAFTAAAKRWSNAGPSSPLSLRGRAPENQARSTAPKAVMFLLLLTSPPSGSTIRSNHLSKEDALGIAKPNPLNSTLYESFTVFLCHFYVCSSPMESRRKAFNSVAWRSAALTSRAGGCTHQGHTELGSDHPNLRVVVVATNDRGTLAALRTAGKLAAHLGARVASTNCISSPPLSSSTATEIVSRWTSIPTYLTLFIRVFLSVRFGCCCLHQPQPTSKGAPFYNACPVCDAKWIARSPSSWWWRTRNRKQRWSGSRTGRPSCPGGRFLR